MVRVRCSTVGIWLSASSLRLSVSRSKPRRIWCKVQGLRWIIRASKQPLDLQTRGSFHAIVTHFVPEFLPSYATLTLVAFLNILDHRQWLPENWRKNNHMCRVPKPVQGWLTWFDKQNVDKHYKNRVFLKLYWILKNWNLFVSEFIIW